ADARDAPTAYFYVTISDIGFAQLTVTPVHDGWRDPGQFTRIGMRLYPAQTVRCSDVRPDAAIADLPEYLGPPRLLDGFSDTASFLNIGAGEPHTAIAWSEVRDPPPGVDEDPLAVGYGCVDLSARQLPNSPVQVAVVIGDRDLVADESALVSSFDLAPVRTALQLRGLQRPWQILACPAGPGQLLLDCTLDAVAPDGSLDCAATASTDLTEAVAALRGPPDGMGCRPPDLPDGPSLDRQLTEAVAAGASFPVDDVLLDMLAVRTSALQSIELVSRLSTLAEGAARHRLDELVFVGPSGGEFRRALAATSQPVIARAPVAIDVDGDQLSLAAHSFTLRYGSAAAAAFADLA
ncbi:MAG: hypothetical protein AAGC55_33910, partial [Myxococcota bacterium]